MPVKRIDVTTPPGYLVQACACCDEQRTIRLDRGAAETGHEPYNLAANGDLGVSVDEAPPVNVLFEAEDFQDLNAATAAELAAKLSAVIPGVVVSVVASAVGRGDLRSPVLSAVTLSAVSLAASRISVACVQEDPRASPRVSPPSAAP